MCYVAERPDHRPGELRLNLGAVVPRPVRWIKWLAMVFHIVGGWALRGFHLEYLSANPKIPKPTRASVVTEISGTMGRDENSMLSITY